MPKRIEEFSEEIIAEHHNMCIEFLNELSIKYPDRIFSMDSHDSRNITEFVIKSPSGIYATYSVDYMFFDTEYTSFERCNQEMRNDILIHILNCVGSEGVFCRDSGGLVSKW